MAKKYVLRQEPEDSEPFVEKSNVEKVLKHFGADETPEEEPVTAEQLAEKLYDARKRLDDAKKVEAYWSKRAKDQWTSDSKSMVGSFWVEVTTRTRKGSVDWEAYVKDQLNITVEKIPMEYRGTDKHYQEIRIKKST